MKKNDNIHKHHPHILITLLAAFLITSCGIPNAKNTASGGESADFSGEWTDEAGGPTVIDLWRDDAGLWHGEISRSDTEDSASFWSFSGEGNGDTISYSDMQRVRGLYDEEGEVTEESIYTDGSGKLILTEQRLSWQDDKEGAGNGLIFIYSGEY